MKFANWVLDFLMMAVPFLELTEVIAIIPVEYLPYYMLATVIARRGIRMLEDYVGKRRAEKSAE